MSIVLALTVPLISTPTWDATLRTSAVMLASTCTPSSFCSVTSAATISVVTLSSVGWLGGATVPVRLISGVGAATTVTVGTGIVGSAPGVVFPPGALVGSEGVGSGVRTGDLTTTPI